MKKQFSILVVSIAIVGLTLSLVGATSVSKAAPNEGLSKPIPATDVKIIKKVFLPEKGEQKGKPATPPGKEKNGGPAATGDLGTSATGTKYAIVIGICNYPGTSHDICWSDGDSLNMYKALTTLYGYSPENIYLLRDMVSLNTEPYYDPEGVTDSPASIQKIEGAISQIEGKGIMEGDEIVFFFSGHGADGIARDNDKEVRDEGVVTYDEQTGELYVIWDGQLRDRFSETIGKKTTRIVFVFDTCLAGGMNDVAADGRVVNMATEETQVAYVYSKGDSATGEPGEGVFSHFFVNEGMLQGLADVYKHGIDDRNDATLGEDVVVEEAFDYANVIIPTIWKRQDPVISDKFENDLLL